jgi:hypothetical protein
MRIQEHQHETIKKFQPFNIKVETDRKSNQYGCAADALALFSLIDQPVVVTSPLIESIKRETHNSRIIHFTKQIQESGDIIQAFLSQGLGDIAKAQAVTAALTRGECNDIATAWDSFITDAMDSLIATLNAHTKAALNDVPDIDNLLLSVDKDFSLFDLSIEQTKSGKSCDLVFQNTDFLCHVSTGLYSIENKALQHFYKTLLDVSLMFGGTWQEDLIHIGFMEQWTSNNPKEIAAAEKLLVDITNTSADKIEAVVDRARKKKHNKNIFGVIDEMMEYQFCDGIIDDKDDFQEWIKCEVDNQIELNKSSIKLNHVSKGSYTFADCPNTLITEQINALHNAAKRHLYSEPLSSFTLDEDNFSHLTFVLKNDEKNQLLDKVSQEQYENFCNASEDDEIYRLDVKNPNWLDDLKQMTLGLNILFVAINAMTDSLPVIESV